MKEGNKLAILLAIVVGVSIIGFLRGTSDDDYDLSTPLTMWDAQTEEGIPVAPTYAGARQSTTSTGDKVASSCVDCHEERLSTARRGQRTEHPVGVEVPRGAQLADLLAQGGRLAEQEDGSRTLVCRTCHRPHNATEDARLIVTTDEGALCLSCHTAKSTARSLHPVSIKLTADVQAAIRSVGGVADGRLTCLSCHDPHDSTAGTLLRTDGKGANACRLCHSNKARQLGEAGHGGRSCIDCHGLHRASSLAGQGPVAPEAGDQPCVDCHVGPKAPKTQRVDPRAGHPMWAEIPKAMASEDHQGTVGCRDCHVPHSSRRAVLSEATTGAVCTACHEQEAVVVGTDHDASVVKVAGSGQTCLSCHSVHGSSSRPNPPSGVNPASGVCLSCHDGRTAARQIENWTHPKGLLLGMGGLPFRYEGAVPYFGQDGKRTKDRKVGEIACLTCHDVHRWRHGEDKKPGAVDGTEHNSFLRNHSAVAKFCAVCHGADGRPRFLFFHGERFRDLEEE
jgi:predicted CXXCH cytochrome family protein